MTYAELVTAIQNYAENSFNYSTDPTIVNTFINQAETRIYNTAQFPSLRKNMTGNTTGSNPYVSCPADFLSVYSLAVINSGSYEYLLNKDVNFIRQAYPTPNDTGVPRYYALFGPKISGGTVITDELSFIIGPTPDASYHVELHYYYYPESITVAADGRTWLGDNFDSALFNAAMVEAITFMKGEPDLVKLYEDRYIQSIALLKNMADGKLRQDAYRDGQVRVRVA